MRGLGFTEDAVADLMDEWAEPDDEADDFQLLPQNRLTWAVFVRCDWQTLLGMQGLYFAGLQPGEINRVMDLLDVPKEKKLSTFDAVRLCMHTAKPILNEQLMS